MVEEKSFFRVLLVEDNSTHADLIISKLETIQENVSVTVTHDRDELIKKVENGEADLVLCDYYLPGYSGLEVLKVIREIDSHLPFILITGYLPEQSAIQAMREGASDYILKDKMDRLAPAVIRELYNYTNLKESRKKLIYRQKTIDRAYQLAEIGHWEYDVENDLRYWSDTVKSIHRVGSDFDPNNSDTFPLIKDENARKKLLEALNSSIESGHSYETELVVQTPCGENRWVRIIWECEMEGGECKRILGSVQDIHQSKVREIELENALKEKNTLLIEIHHRVKNNLAIISAMLQLQAFSEKDERLQSKLFDSVSRINSMGAIHEVLYKSNTFSRLNFAESIDKLVSSITAAFQSNSDLITKLNIDDNLELNINQAIPLSLIINEVLANTIKHAYDADDSGEIHFSLTRHDSNKIKLVVEDFGKGIPENIEPTSSTLGLTLIETLTKQLEGTYSYSPTGKGTKFELTFTKSEKLGSSSAMN